MNEAMGAEIAREPDALNGLRNDSQQNASDAAISNAAVSRPELLDRLARPPLAIPLLSLCGALLFLVNLGGYALYTKGETREAVTVFDIVHGGGVILPMRAGVEVPSKPLMMHWLAALISLAAGQVNEWTVRLPSALFALLGIIVCYYYVRRFFDDRSALIAALILGTSIQYLQAGGARVDMTLTFFLEVAFFHFLAIAERLTKRTEILYLAIACAVLTKGPVGLVLPVLVAASWMALTGRVGLLRELKLGQGALIVGAIGGGWYIAAIITGGSAFIHKQLLAENVYRVFARHGFNEGHAHPFYYMEAALGAGFMPWSPLAVVAALEFWKAPFKRSPRFSYMLVWFVAVLVFYNLPHSKRGIYLLALYPALSTTVALILSHASQRPSPLFRRSINLIARAAGLFFIVAGISAAAGCVMLFYWLLPIRWMLARLGILVAELPEALRATAAHHWLAVGLILLTAIAAGAWMLLSRPGIDRIILGVAAGMIAITLAVNVIIEPATADTLSSKEFAAEVRQRAGAQPVYYFGSLDYGYIFYSGSDVRFVSVDHPPALLVGSEEQWRLMPTNFRRRYQVLLRSNPTELDGSGQLILLGRTATPS
ncbi:MAG TPA: glycosyltransferase family 39 protein [Candidatus Binataceae bacterium]|nr:glycosyltransferase family 39 protein [Candidatus Binataceae bacterium]